MNNPLAETAASILSRAGEIEKADVELGERAARQREHPAVKAVGMAGKIGDQGPLYALSAGLLLFGLLSGRRRAASSGVLMFGAVALADLTKTLLKKQVRRTRPHVLLEEGRYEARIGGSEEKPEQSFPSGHTAGSVAVARALSRTHPLAGAAAGVAALAVGASRVAKGAHWPLDTLAGALVGLFAEQASSTLLHQLWRALSLRSRRKLLHLLPNGCSHATFLHRLESEADLVHEWLMERWKTQRR